MTDSKDVKRWRGMTQETEWDDNCKLDRCKWADLVLASDHDRIVAELRAEVSTALKRVFDRQVGYMVSANAFRVLAEEIQKYDPAFVLPGSFARRKFVADRNDKIQELKQTIATQARVIEIAKRVLHNAGLRPPDGGNPTVETICEDLNDAIKAIAAIERAEGAKNAQR